MDVIISSYLIITTNWILLVILTNFILSARRGVAKRNEGFNPTKYKQLNRNMFNNNFLAKNMANSVNYQSCYLGQIFFIQAFLNQTRLIATVFIIYSKYILESQLRMDDMHLSILDLRFMLSQLVQKSVIECSCAS